MKVNIPNILTLFRLLLVPLFIIVFHSEQNMHLLAAIIFIVASITDVADGYIARKYNMTSRWGQLMDPLADKCMQLAVIISLFSAGQVPGWFILLLVVKEVTMITGGVFLYSKKTYVKANAFGKLNTVFLFLVMSLILFLPDMNSWVKDVLLGISAMLMLLAAATYLYLYFVHDKQFKQYTSGGRKEEKI